MIRRPGIGGSAAHDTTPPALSAGRDGQPDQASRSDGEVAKFFSIPNGFRSDTAKNGKQISTKDHITDKLSSKLLRSA
jgi:hypothetical protein